MEEKIKELQLETRRLRDLIANMEFIVKRINTDIKLVSKEVQDIKDGLHQYN